MIMNSGKMISIFLTTKESKTKKQKTVTIFDIPLRQ